MTLSNSAIIVEIHVSGETQSSNTIRPHALAGRGGDRGPSLGVRCERRWRLLAWLETAHAYGRHHAYGRRCRLLLARHDRVGDLWCGQRQTHRRREEIELFSARHRTVGKRLLPSQTRLAMIWQTVPATIKTRPSQRHQSYRCCRFWKSSRTPIMVNSRPMMLSVATGSGTDSFPLMPT